MHTVFRPSAEIVDLGCGTGREAPLLADDIDFSDRPIAGYVRSKKGRMLCVAVYPKGRVYEVDRPEDWYMCEPSNLVPKSS